MTATALPADEARQELYEIMRGAAPFEEKAPRALDLGKRFLGAENGHLTRIDEETNHWEAMISTDPTDGQFPPGLELDLGMTYCRRTIEAETPIALSNVPEQGWEEDPAFKEHRLHCYHGTTLILDDEPYGTVCFVSQDPRELAFSESETMFAELLARMLERELEHEQHEEQLARQTNLSTVLNRVLRHNIRNDMAVIRGYTQLMRSDARNESYAEKTLQEIDDLLALSDKARELERIVGQSAELERRDLGELVQECVTEIESGYPTASIHMEIGEDVEAAVFPTFSRAIEELIENAAKHAGPSSMIEISVERVPNAVEIKISDDGPGLSDQDQAVFSTGIETSLIHGSGLGLWIVHWIINSHGGTSDASVSEDGTTMTISIPHGPEVEYDKTIAEIQQARDIYEAAFDESMDAMVIINDEAKILDANPQSKEIFGLERQELLGRSVPEFLSEEFDFEAAWDEFKEGGAIGTAEFIRADGDSIIVEYTGKPNVIPGQHFVIYRDVTKVRQNKAQLEEERLMTNSIFAAIPDTMYLIDPEGYPIIWNENVEEVTGYHSDEIGEMHITEFIPDEDVEMITEAFKAVVEQGETVTVETAYETKDGKRIPYEFTGTPLEASDGTLRGLTGIGRRLPYPARRTSGQLDTPSRY